MKIKELEELLSRYPEDAEVMVAGYEGGYHSDLMIGEEEIVLNVHKEWYYGPHEATNSLYKEEDEGKPSVKVLVIGYHDTREDRS